jgi:hypothetical protein
VDRFLAGGRAIWDQDATWAQPLSGAGKVEFLRRKLSELAPLSGAAGSRDTARFEVFVGYPMSREGQIWLLDLLQDLCSVSREIVKPLLLGRVDATLNRAVVLQLAADDGRRYIAKVAMQPQVAEAMGREERIIREVRRQLHAHNVLLETLPETLGSGQSHGTYYRLDRRLAGRPAIETMYENKGRERIVGQAVEWLKRFHKATVGRPLEAQAAFDDAQEVLSRFRRQEVFNDGLFADRIATYLAERLRAAQCPAVFGHGDFWLGNILYERSDNSTVGVIDWDFADKLSPPLEDLLHLLCHRKSLITVYDPGAHLASLLLGRYCATDRHAISAYLRWMDIEPDLAGPLIVMYWIRYLGSRAATLSGRRHWNRRSYSRVKNVLESMTDQDLDGLGRQLAGAR